MEYVDTLHTIITETLNTSQKTILRCFGSSRLGLNGNDIDCILLTPNTFTREDVFSTLGNAFAKDQRFSDVRIIANAYVPLIKFTFNTEKIEKVEMHFDLLHCVLPYKTLDLFVDDTFLFDDSILRSLDTKSFLSLNGFRTTEKILKLVPNVDHFLSLLSMVKSWAKKRCLYSNIMGYWGGITWTIAVAKICQLSNISNISSNISNISEVDYTTNLFKTFIHVMASWEWPTPLTISKIDNFRYSPELEPWDPSHADHEYMPVLTPAYPSKNSSYNVMKSTSALLKKEFKRAYQLSLSPSTFPDIFNESTFLTDYDHYLTILPTTIDLSNYNTWKGFVESKIKICVKLLEASVDMLEAIPYSKDVDGAFYIALRFSNHTKEDKKKKEEDKKETEEKEEDNEDVNKKLLNGCEAFLSHLLSLSDSPYVKDKMDINIKIM